MTLSNALFSSVSGLDTTSTAISVIGDNIANVNTTGFKERRAEFSDVLGQTITAASGFSSVGAGSKLNRVSTIFSQGTFESTGRSTDLAIQGQGFFIVDGQNGRAYSRAGIFDIDSQGTVVNPSGMRLQGYGVDSATGLPNGQLGDISISTAFSSPNPTGTLKMSMNLDPTAPVGTGYDPTDPTGSTNYSTSATFYDSLGAPHFATIRFDRSGAGAWNWTAVLDQADTTISPAPGANEVVQGSGTLSFNSDGELTGVTGQSMTFEFSGGATPGQAVDLDFGAIAGGLGTPVTTSYAARESVTNSFSQDGFAAGTLQSISIDGDGIVTGGFSNGETLPLAQVALASFANVEGLTAVGNNNMQESRASGQALIGGPGSGSFGTVRASSLEQSTVDLAAQFVRLIINQRAFQANTRTVSVTNELLANLVSLGQ